MSHFDLRRFKAIPDLPSTIFFLYISGLRLFLLQLQLNRQCTCYSPLFSKLREDTPGMAVLTRREVDDSGRAAFRFLSKVEIFPFFQSWFKQSKGVFNLLSEDFKTIEAEVDECRFRFRSRIGVPMNS